MNVTRIVSSIICLGSAKLAESDIATVVSIVVILLLEPTDYGLTAMLLVITLIPLCSCLSLRFSHLPALSWSHASRRSSR